MSQTSKWKDIVEIIALFAVVASLVAVAFELRQTQAALRAQAYQARAFQAYENHYYMAEHPEFASLSQSVQESDFDPDELSFEERNALNRMFSAAMTDVDNEYYQYQNGFLDESFYLTTTVVDIKFYAPIWRKLGIESLRPDFKAEVDRILAEEESD
jgi:hypothetical protein